MEEIIISIFFNYHIVSKVKHLTLQHLNITQVNHIYYTQEYFFLLFMTYDVLGRLLWKCEQLPYLKYIK